MSDWVSDVCSSDLYGCQQQQRHKLGEPEQAEKEGAFGAGKAVIAAGDVVCLITDQNHHRHRGEDGEETRRPVSSKIGNRQRGQGLLRRLGRSEEHTSELQSLMRISSADFCLKNKTQMNRSYGFCS